MRAAKALTGTVLLAEVDDALALAMARELQQLGLEVHRVNTGKDAFEATCFRKPRPDLVVMEVLLPGLSGIEVALLLRDYERRRHLPAVPVLGCSDLQRYQTHQAMLRAGMNAVVQKPLPHGRLVAIAAQLLKADELSKARPLGPGAGKAPEPGMQTSMSAQ